MFATRGVQNLGYFHTLMQPLTVTSPWKCRVEYYNMRGFAMSYRDFQIRVTARLARSNTGITARFFNRDGKHIAKCSDGSTIIGNSTSYRVLVMWGSGHRAFATI